MNSLIITLCILLCVTGYTCFNLFRKVEKLEAVVFSQNQFISSFGHALGYADEKLAAIDEKGAFQSDDEIGWFFESVKTLQRDLNDFNLTSPVIPAIPPLVNENFTPINKDKIPLFETTNKLNDRN